MPKQPSWDPDNNGAPYRRCAGCGQDLDDLISDALPADYRGQSFCPDCYEQLRKNQNI